MSFLNFIHHHQVLTDKNVPTGILFAILDHFNLNRVEYVLSQEVINYTMTRIQDPQRHRC